MNLSNQIYSHPRASRRSHLLRRCVALVMMLALFAPLAPTVNVASANGGGRAFDKKGEKEYKRGLQFEAAQKWEEAAQAFALALAARPDNVEYQLHYRRAVFNASQMFMIRARALAEQGDFVGAYNTFRQAFGYDPVNQLAQSEMERMIRLQQAKEDANGTSGRSSITRDGQNGDSNQNTATPPTSSTAPRVTPTAYVAPQQQGTATAIRDVAAPRSEVKTVISYSDVDLENVIRNLAEQLNLNVVFDGQFQGRNRKVSYNLRDVTVAQALDYIFLTQGLFFQRLGRRTILVAEQAKRPQYQQLVLRTFYLQNVDPTPVGNIIRQVVQAVGGIVPIVAPNTATNSITVRATPEQIRLIGSIIKSIDKDRAEVVMDVSIYEVSRTDLLQLGGQIGTTGTNSSLLNLGGTSGLVVPFTETLGGLGGTLPTALGAGLVLPSLQLSALQRKDNTRLLAQTQVHAFDGEPTKARIGERVPVQTASYQPFNSGTQQPPTGGTTPPGSQFGGLGGGFPVINYEPIGLTLTLTPTVYPNLDVQVKMEIENKSIVGEASATPTFTERTISGTARIQNNRTMMLASISQDRESRGRTGIPLLGLIPILGRLITTPTRNNSKSDVVIAVTPRVLRAPAIKPSDELEFPSGYQTAPVAESLEAFLQVADREETLARGGQPATQPAVNQPLQTPIAAPAASLQAANVNVPPATSSALPTATPVASNVVAVNANSNGKSNGNAAPIPNSAALTSAPLVEPLPSYIPAPLALMGKSPAIDIGGQNALTNIAT